ncbi:hypothetical protein NDU88_005719 [Pleurodeles waltl]|uniref:Uncharacterized protein n=1 Tax=Pleurodeles waltl TaxID=8319 RepID=A0AAV7TV50_PLEWA|nr:hypothetical protein NDU88_005719 [Pleurodeles waltl]
MLKMADDHTHLPVMVDRGRLSSLPLACVAEDAHCFCYADGAFPMRHPQTQCRSRDPHLARDIGPNTLVPGPTNGSLDTCGTREAHGMGSASVESTGAARWAKPQDPRLPSRI